MRLADTLKHLRILKKITQKELAKILNVTRTCVTNWESGTRKPSVEDLSNISKFFDYPLVELVKLLLAEKTLQEVNELNQDKTNTKTKISFIVPIFNLILTAIVCITLVATLIIAKNINQGSKYEKGIIYEDEIEKISLDITNNRFKNKLDFIFDRDKKIFEINNIFLPSKFDSTFFVNEKIYISIFIKYYNYNKFVQPAISFYETNQNLLKLSENGKIFVSYQDIIPYLPLAVNLNLLF